MSRLDKQIELQKKLIHACMKNDRRAQLRIYKQYSKAMYNVCLNMINDTAQGEDLMQEAFISAFGNISSFKGEVTFGAWLKKITVNKCLDHLKKKKVLFENIEEHKNIEAEPENDSDKEFLEHSAQKIKQAIRELPDGYRTILSLYLFEGYDHGEIADILEISASTSRSQYIRAKAVLVKKLKEQG